MDGDTNLKTYNLRKKTKTMEMTKESEANKFEL